MPSELTKSNRPLGIIDLMILTAAIAFMFMIFESKLAYQGEQWIYQVFKFASAGVNGTFLASIVWLLWQRARTGRFFHHPGHWILGAELIGVAGVIGFWVVIWSVYRNKEAIDHFLHGIGYFVSAGLYLFALGIFVTAVSSTERRWRIPMVLLAANCLTKALTSVFWGFLIMDRLEGMWSFDFGEKLQVGSRIVAVCAAIAICTVAINDLRKKVPRDWLHWVGLIATFALLTVLPFLGYLFIQL